MATSSIHLILVSGVMIIIGLSQLECSNLPDLSNEELVRQIRTESMAMDNKFYTKLRRTLLVTKVKEALARGVLTRAQQTRVQGQDRESTDLYWVKSSGEELRLPAVDEVIVMSHPDTMEDRSNVVTHKLVQGRDRISGDLYQVNSSGVELRLPAVDDVIVTNHPQSDTTQDQSNQPQVYGAYRSLLEALQKGLPNIFTESFVKDAVRDMEVDMLSIKIAQKPDEKYYGLVLKVFEALNLEQIRRIPDTLLKGDHGVNTELYLTTENHITHQVLLPTVKDLDKARQFFENGRRAREEMLEHQKQKYLKSYYGRYHLNSLISDMLQISIDSDRNELYYSLVRRTDSARKNNLIKPIKDTEYTGLRGVKTTVYKLMEGEDKIVLPSWKDLPEENEERNVEGEITTPLQTQRSGTMTDNTDGENDKHQKTSDREDSLQEEGSPSINADSDAFIRRMRQKIQEENQYQDDSPINNNNEGLKPNPDTKYTDLKERQTQPNREAEPEKNSVQESQTPIEESTINPQNTEIKNTRGSDLIKPNPPKRRWSFRKLFRGLFKREA